jgi:hypothetical protein
MTKHQRASEFSVRRTNLSLAITDAPTIADATPSQAARISFAIEPGVSFNPSIKKIFFTEGARNSASDTPKFPAPNQRNRKSNASSGDCLLRAHSSLAA